MSFIHPPPPRYRTAALVLKCIIETMRQGIEVRFFLNRGMTSVPFHSGGRRGVGGAVTQRSLPLQPLPRHLPPPTKLHLLLAHSLLLCGEYLECITVSDQLLSALDPAMDAGQVTLEAGLPIPSVVSMVTWLQGLFIRGSALQCEGRPGDGQQCYQRWESHHMCYIYICVSGVLCAHAQNTEDYKCSTSPSAEFS